ncbi:MAG: SDR family NAD(P)-dependent oxidoreductase, partial [Nannocystaceae bacterium]
VDLRGRVAVVTGGRIKIGHAIARRLLDWGARVVVTTRFPSDAARRFAAAPDFADFADRLEIYGLDLRDLPALEGFCAGLLAKHPRIDALVNNAAQTIRRPPAFYAELFALEEAGAAALPPAARALLPPPLAERRAAPAGAGGLALRDAAALFPAGSDDGFGQPEDHRPTNSWRLRLDEVSTIELVETQLINVAAPFVLSARLRRAMARADAADDGAFIVQVAAPEGQFYRHYKAPFHPHTNMAKAALNMLTRTSAEDYAGDRIFMTSVDTGWASNENPRPIAEAMRARGFTPPLDMIDAATRVCDPIARGLGDGEFLFGVLLKDFRPIPW